MENSKESLSHFQKLTNLATCEVTNNSCYSQKGFYILDENSFFILIPNYLSETDISNINNDTFDLDFTKNFSNRYTHYIGPQYSYTGTSHAQNLKWPSTLIKTKAKLESQFELPINSLLINKYSRDQSMPFHQDNESCLWNAPIIYSLSTGETKNMVVKNMENDVNVSIQLNSGTLLIMAGKFNELWKHGIPNKCKKQRINLTFRFVYPNPCVPTSTEPLDDSLHQEMAEVKISIKKLEAQLDEMKLLLAESNNNLMKQKDKEIQLLQKNFHQQEQPEDTKIVILKSESTIDSSINSEKCANLLNKHLLDKKIAINDIKAISDFREKKGPIIVEFHKMSAKINILKQMKKNKSLVIKNCLNKKETQLRKSLIKLKERKMVSKIWDYKGEIF